MSRQSELNAAYRSARSNYLSNLRSMESRGYEFDRNMRPDIPKRITEGSIRRIQNLNQNRYRHASYNGYTGEEGRRQERKEARERAKLHRQAEEALIKLDQLAGAMQFQTEQASPGGTTEAFFNSLMNDVAGIIATAEKDDAYAVRAAPILDDNWDEIQTSLEIIALYKDIEDAPGDIVDRLIIIIREAQGRPVTQEDMRMAGTLGETPDYYPTE